MSESCTSITCCLGVPDLMRSFSLVVDIKPHDQIAYISLEGKMVELALKEDQRRHSGRLSLNGLINLE